MLQLCQTLHFCQALHFRQAMSRSCCQKRRLTISSGRQTLGATGCLAGLAGTAPLNRLTGNHLTGDSLTGNSLTGDSLTGDSLTGNSLHGNRLTGDSLTGLAGTSLTGSGTIDVWRVTDESNKKSYCNVEHFCQ